jgi:hypothetical protein
LVTRWRSPTVAKVACVPTRAGSPKLTVPTAPVCARAPEAGQLSAQPGWVLAAARARPRGRASAVDGRDRRRRSEPWPSARASSRSRCATLVSHATTTPRIAWTRPTSVSCDEVQHVRGGLSDQRVARPLRFGPTVVAP